MFKTTEVLGTNYTLTEQTEKGPVVKEKYKNDYPKSPTSQIKKFIFHLFSKNFSQTKQSTNAEKERSSRTCGLKLSKGNSFTNKQWRKEQGRKRVNYQHCHSRPWEPERRLVCSFGQKGGEKSSAGTNRRSLLLRHSGRPNRGRRHSCRCCSSTRPWTSSLLFLLLVTTVVICVQLGTVGDMKLRKRERERNEGAGK